MERMTDVGCGGEGGGRKEEKGFFLVGGEGGGGNRWERGRHGNKGIFSLRASNSNSYHHVYLFCPTKGWTVRLLLKKGIFSFFNE